MLLLQISAVVIGFMCVSLIPSVLGITVLNSSSAGFVWEILSTIQQLPETRQSEYAEYLDFLSHPGSTKEALAVNDFDSVNGWLWDIFPPGTIGQSDNPKQILHSYIEMVLTEPKAYAKNKIAFIGRSLGIQQPTYDWGFYYDGRANLYQYGAVDNPVRKAFVDSYHRFHEMFPVFRMPYVWFLAGVSVLAYFYFRRRSRFRSGVLLFFIATFYYGAFFINTQSFEFRYFFPSFYYLFLLVIPTLLQIFSHACSYVFRQLRPHQHP